MTCKNYPSKKDLMLNDEIKAHILNNALYTALVYFKY